MHGPDNLPPFIEVDVAYYDEAERKKFRSQITAGAIDQVAGSRIRIPTQQFLAYLLFHRKRLGIPAFRDYKSIAKNVNDSLAITRGALDFTHHSVRTAPDVQRQNPHLSELVGESIGLSVANEIHGLTEADWSPIEQEWGRGANPTFDFELASDRKTLIQVEAKGSSVTDNTILNEAISGHRRNIIRKKEKILEFEKDGHRLSPPTIRYGTITALDPRPGSRAVCRLVDPPAQPTEFGAEKIRLLKRLHFIHRWISFINPRTELASSLATRLFDLVSATDPFEFNEVPLRRGDGEPIEYAAHDSAGHSMFVLNKSKVSAPPAAGIVIQPRAAELFFAGAREDFWRMAVQQSFEEILRYRAEVASITQTVGCVISRGRYDRLRLPQSVIDAVDESGGYVRFQIEGVIHYSLGGLAYGVLPLPDR